MKLTSKNKAKIDAFVNSMSPEELYRKAVDQYKFPIRKNIKMVDNFNLIRDILDFSHEGDFYFLQIIKRRKDSGNENMKKSEKLIKTFHIYSEEEFDSLKNTIIDYCIEHNARAYLKYNKRNTKKVALQTLRKVAELISEEQYKSIKGVYNSMCGKYSSSGKNKLWLVDIDNKSENLDFIVKEIKEFIYDKDRKDEYHIIPSKNGWHILVPPFNVEKVIVMDLFDIHKDNYTNLFIP